MCDPHLYECMFLTNEVRMGIELTLTETPASTLLLEQPHEETNSHKQLCARPAEKEKNVLNWGKKRGGGGLKRSMAQMQKWCTVSRVTLCKSLGGWPLTIKSDKLWLVFFAALCFFRGEMQQKQGWARDWRREATPHLPHLWHWWKHVGYSGDRSMRCLRLPWELG